MIKELPFSVFVRETWAAYVALLFKHPDCDYTKGDGYLAWIRGMALRCTSYLLLMLFPHVVHIVRKDWTEGSGALRKSVEVFSEKNLAMLRLKLLLLGEPNGE